MSAITSSFNYLWGGIDSSVVVKRKELQDFIQQQEANGKTLIIVKGTVRLVKWKTMGVGLYRVYTVEDK